MPSSDYVKETKKLGVAKRGHALDVAEDISELVVVPVRFAMTEGDSTRHDTSMPIVTGGVDRPLHCKSAWVPVWNQSGY